MISYACLESMTAAPPFEVLRWESQLPPNPEKLAKVLRREGLSSVTSTYEEGSHTEERKLPVAQTLVLVSGRLQVSFPGYGVVELQPGDQLDITPNTIHDLKVLGTQAATLLTGMVEEENGARP